MKILVLGGSGFIGQAVVEVLAERGYEITIATRKPLNHPFAHKACVVKKIEFHRLRRVSDWPGYLSGFDVIVNCVGILRERWKETFESVYHEVPAALAKACSRLKKRFIHVTALGLTQQAQSRFILMKRLGEKAIEQIEGEICIVRPSLLDGKDGFGAGWLRRVAQWPIHFIPKCAVGKIAPMHVRDLGEAIAALCVCSVEALPTSIEFGGEKHYQMSQYLDVLRIKKAPPIKFSLPACIVRSCAHIFDLLHLTPLSWGHVELMRRDNLPRQEDTFALRLWIGRRPIEIDAQSIRPNTTHPYRND
ncbi:MAG: NAD-dependent epimerase/dehydratase family protein [Burkholderiaceae bacterium]|nr:NAD-dependent epimerase/dehydratase family protein [Burkholderiaceae bacterium]